jgi:primase-polymerase (primpol)-like protein
MSAAGVTGPASAVGIKPNFLRPEFDNMPAELKSLRNWVAWKYLPPKREGGKWRKAPFQPNGRAASTTDRSTWNSFDACCVAYDQGGFDGVGFVFDGEIGADGLTYCGIDLDHCVDEEKVQSLATLRIGHLNTYTELSVSGTGVHCIVRAAPIDRIVKYDGVEVYTTARYFTFTGRAFGTIRAAPVETQALIGEVRAKQAADSEQHQDLPRSPTTGQPAGGDGWFDQLPPELKNQVLDHALEVIAARTKYLELEEYGGNNDLYYRLMQSCARSGAPGAEDLWVKWASQAHQADPEDTLRDEFHRCMCAPIPKGTP